LTTSQVSWVSFIATAIVGATFVWSGTIKAVSPHVFEQHLARLAILRRKFIPSAVVAAAAFEVGWGVALVLRVAPGVVMPASIALLAAFSAVSWWGVHTGRTTDCGCYGGYVTPSVGQSVAINAFFIALIVIAWLAGGSTVDTPTWKIVIVLFAAAASGSVAAAGQDFLAREGRFMFDMSPLKVGERWNERWGAPLRDDREHLISYLGPDCPHCKQWVRVLNAVDQAQGLPTVTGVVATTRDKLENFVQASGIRFPMRTISQSEMGRLVWGVPTTVLVAEGTIQRHWSGQMPPEFFQRFKEAFFPGATAVGAGAGAAADVPLATRST
jgi:hypothetical protein